VYKFTENMDQEHFDNIMTELEPFEKELASRGKVFFGGNETELFNECNVYWKLPVKIDGNT
jgi:hypothetical protein